MGALNFNMLSPEEVDNLFSDSSASDDGTSLETGTQKDKEKETTTEVVNPEDLFKPESVGSEETNKGQESTSSTKEGISPKQNFYSSIAKSLEEEGIFPDLTEDDFKSINEASDFRDIIEKQIKAGLDAKQKRIDDALNYGLEPNVIQQYENTLDVLNNITDAQLEDEGDSGADLRRRIIAQDYINRGFTQDKVKKLVDAAFAAGTDIEDAKEALSGARQFYTKSYQDLVNSKKEEAEQSNKQLKEEAETLKKSILEDKNIFGSLDIDKKTRQKVYDSMMTPIYKDPETGKYLTAIQKYQKENGRDFMKNLALFFTLTNGFKDVDSLIKGKVKKEVSKSLSNLEQLINTSENFNGNPSFVGRKDAESVFMGYRLDK